MKIDGIWWDHGNWPKCGKHGLTQDEIEFVLKHLPRVAPDIAHADVEDRFVAIGRTPTGRAAFVGFTYRLVDGLRYIRPITARYMHRKELKRYDPQGPEDEN